MRNLIKISLLILVVNICYAGRMPASTQCVQQKVIDDNIIDSVHGIVYDKSTGIMYSCTYKTKQYDVGARSLKVYEAQTGYPLHIYCVKDIAGHILTQLKSCPPQPQYPQFCYARRKRIKELKKFRKYCVCQFQKHLNKPDKNIIDSLISVDFLIDCTNGRVTAWKISTKIDLLTVYSPQEIIQIFDKISQYDFPLPIAKRKFDKIFICSIALYNFK